jgi:hypothetical protein
VLEQSQHVFVAGASTALTVAAGLLLLTVVVVSQLHRAPRPSATVAEATS